MAERKFSLSAYPLCWPEGWTRSGTQKEGHFSRGGQYPTIMEGLNRVLRELKMMGVNKEDLLVSTNVPTRLDGMPRSDQREPDDSGVAVYWRDGQNGPMKCMAIDIYKRVAFNLCAIAATLEAMRAIERHGGAQIKERSFRGFAALPAHTGKRPWREVLDFMPGTSPHEQVIKDQFHSLARTRHPDAGGTDDLMAELNVALAEALRETRQ